VKFGITSPASENEFEAKLRAAEFPADIYKVAGPSAGALYGAASRHFTDDGDTDRDSRGCGRVAADGTDPKRPSRARHAAEKII
jgi:hypothetical protein